MANPILVINTGNTSTKVGLYNSKKPAFVEVIRHSDQSLARFKDINAQKDFREDIVVEFLKEKRVEIRQLAAVAARGGLLKPLESGTYRVNQKMIDDLIEARRGLHASHLSAQIGLSIAQRAGVSCFVVDPISVDELEPIARYSGHKLFERNMLSHALNMKAVAKRYARENHLDYRKITLIVIHLGTGISVSVHKNGSMVDAVNPTEEGAFSLDRSGGLPVLQVARYVIDQKLSFKEFRDLVWNNGGLYSYLNTRDFMKVEELYKKGDPETIGVVEAMAYQVAREVGALAAVACGKVDAIVMSGGMARADFFVKLIQQRIRFIAPIQVYPGEDEMEALAEGVYRVLEGEEEAREY
jgi:butyrate kinase